MSVNPVFSEQTFILEAYRRPASPGMKLPYGWST
jgi:hypothetical protein